MKTLLIVLCILFVLGLGLFVVGIYGMNRQWIRVISRKELRERI